MTSTSIYRIVPSDNLRDFDAAGPGNEFDNFDKAAHAAGSLDDSCPLDGVHQWCVVESNGAGGWALVAGSVPGVTNAQIETLLTEARLAGDSKMANLCEHALEGDGDAIQACLAAINDAAAQV